MGSTPTPGSSIRMCENSPWGGISWTILEPEPGKEGLRRDLRGMVPLLRIVFYLELFWAIFSSNPRVICPDHVFRIGKSSTFVRDESAWSLREVLAEAQSSRGRGNVGP